MGKNGRRHRNHQQHQYQDEASDAQDFFDHRRGIHKPPSSKQSYNPFEKYLKPPPPYEATNPHTNRNSFSLRNHDLHLNAPRGPRIYESSHITAKWNIRQRNLKRYLVQTLNAAVRQIDHYLPDHDFDSSDNDSEGEEEMDWQPEFEVVIPQPFEALYPWPAGMVAKGCFERPAWALDNVLSEDEERVNLKLDRGVWMANANGRDGGGAATRRMRFEVGRKRDWDEESMPDSP